MRSFNELVTFECLLEKALAFCIGSAAGVQDRVRVGKTASRALGSQDQLTAPSAP